MRKIETNLETYFDCCTRCILLDHSSCNSILIRSEILVLDPEGYLWKAIVIEMNFIQNPATKKFLVECVNQQRALQTEYLKFVTIPCRSSSLYKLLTDQSSLICF